MQFIAMSEANALDTFPSPRRPLMDLLWHGTFPGTAESLDVDDFWDRRILRSRGYDVY